MELVDRIKSMFTDTGERETYTYECTNCGERFDSAKQNVAEVRCPECGAGKVQDATIKT